MILKKVRYVVHPDDVFLLGLEVGEGLEEIKVVYDVSNKANPFITQVADRLTIADHVVGVKDEFVVHPLDEDNVK
jgi:hypothetical protein